MAQKYKVLFLFCIFTTYFMNDVRALFIEGILGGSEAQENELNYQASLNLQKLYNMIEPICAASIIGDRFLLATASCVVDGTGKFWNRTYEAIVGSKNLKKVNDGIVYAVKTIYIPKDYNVRNSFNDLSVVELKDSLELKKINSFLTKLKLPDHEPSYKGVIAKLSAYGYTKMELTEDPTKLIELKYLFFTDWKLKHIDVKVMSNSECQSRYKSLAPSFICGKSVPLYKGQRCGPCLNDYGGPLVDGDEIIGILSSARPRCADNDHPSLYTEIYPLRSFIENIMNGTTLPETRIYDNLRDSANDISNF